MLCLMKVGDDDIRAVIGELRERGVRLSGARLRRELFQRFGARGGVARVYRLLQEAPAGKPADLADIEARLAVLEAQNQALGAARDAALERAALAEHREEAHQQKWAMEVDALRQELAALRPERRWSLGGGGGGTSG